jgi:hypothetical protein
MQICSPIKSRTSVAGTYKPKKSNIKKLKVYLNKIENGS